METEGGSYSWPEATGYELITLPCDPGALVAGANVTRLCSDGGQWQAPDLESCLPSVHVTYTFETIRNESVSSPLLYPAKANLFFNLFLIQYLLC